MLRYVYYVVLPLVLGTLPYLFFRKDPSVFLVTIQKLLRSYFETDFNHRQVFRLDSTWDWVVYNLPDALWAFSFTSFVLLSTSTDSRNIKFLYLFISIAIMLVLEIGVGTFDWLDVTAMFIGSCASISTLRSSLKE